MSLIPCVFQIYVIMMDPSSLSLLSEGPPKKKLKSSTHVTDSLCESVAIVDPKSNENAVSAKTSPKILPRPKSRSSEPDSDSTDEMTLNIKDSKAEEEDIWGRGDCAIDW